METLKFGKWGTPVFWVLFALQLVAAGWATIPGRNGGAQIHSLLPVLGFLPWKWVFAAAFFVALGVACFFALIVDDYMKSRPQPTPADRYQLEQ